jgi:hypothetical protein
MSFPQYKGRKRQFSVFLASIRSIFPLNQFGSSLNYKSSDSPAETLPNDTMILSLICG